MAANSFKQMIKSGVIKRNDGGMLIRIGEVHVKEELDLRVDDERTREADDNLVAHLMAGGPVPPLEVVARDEGGVWVVEGHRRRRCFIRCLEAGKPIEWISITQFTGNDVDRLARVMTSNNQLPLSKIEQARVIKELLAFNLSPDEIAKLVNKSRSYVDDLIVLASSNHDVQNLVREGYVAPSAAVARVKEHGESAGEVLKADVEKAKAEGKKRLVKADVTAPKSDVEKAERLKLLKQLAGLLSKAEAVTIDGMEHIFPRFGTVPIIMKILEELNGYKGQVGE